MINTVIIIPFPEHESMVGFCVATLVPRQQSDGERVPYEVIWSNIWRRYDTQLHKFVHHDTGFYLFTMAMLPSSAGSDVIINVNGETKGGEYFCLQFDID